MDRSNLPSLRVVRCSPDSPEDLARQVREEIIRHENAHPSFESR